MRGSSALIIWGEKILLFHRDNNPLISYPDCWEPPGGRIEKDETPKQAAIREASEETGITDIEFIDGFEEKIQYGYQFGGKAVRKEVVFFLAKTNAKDVKISHEHLDYIWLEYDDALKKTTYQNAKNLLMKSKGLVFSQVKQ